MVTVDGGLGGLIPARLRREGASWHGDMGARLVDRLTSGPVGKGDSEHGRLGVGETELKGGGSRGESDDWLGNMAAALIPVSGFPMRC
jgi:hypothetical protein